MEINGIVHEIYDTVQITDTFKKREIIIEYAENPAYPEYVKMEAIQDKTNLFDNLNKGDKVTVSFNLRGRAWSDSKTGKTNYFNTLQVWRISHVNASLSSGMQQAASVNNISTPNNMPQASTISNSSIASNLNDDDNDLPF